MKLDIDEALTIVLSDVIRIYNNCTRQQVIYYQLLKFKHKKGNLLEKTKEKALVKLGCVKIKEKQESIWEIKIKNKKKKLTINKAFEDAVDFAVSNSLNKIKMDYFRDLRSRYKCHNNVSEKTKEKILKKFGWVKIKGKQQSIWTI